MILHLIKAIYVAFVITIMSRDLCFVLLTVLSADRV
jgi:hypothetical protein